MKMAKKDYIATNNAELAELYYNIASVEKGETYAAKAAQSIRKRKGDLIQYFLQNGSLDGTQMRSSWKKQVLERLIMGEFPQLMAEAQNTRRLNGGHEVLEYVEVTPAYEPAPGDDDSWRVQELSGQQVVNSRF